jgi:hypothetical protein
MSIDGRRIAEADKPLMPDPYAARGVGVAANLIVWVPLAAFVLFTYWSGTFFGGAAGGMLSVASTAGMIGVLYLLKRAKRR